MIASHVQCLRAGAHLTFHLTRSVLKRAESVGPWAGSKSIWHVGCEPTMSFLKTRSCYRGKWASNTVTLTDPACGGIDNSESVSSGGTVSLLHSSSHDINSPDGLIYIRSLISHWMACSQAWMPEHLRLYVRIAACLCLSVSVADAVCRSLCLHACIAASVSVSAYVCAPACCCACVHACFYTCMPTCLNWLVGLRLRASMPVCVRVEFDVASTRQSAHKRGQRMQGTWTHMRSGLRTINTYQQ